MGITSFNQYKGESLYETWERFNSKEMSTPWPSGVVDCSNFLPWSYLSNQDTIDSAARGALMEKSPVDAQIITNNY